MRVDDVRAVLARVCCSIALTSPALVAPQVLAQEGESEGSAESSEVRDAQTKADEVVVTGSRLKRDTFTSISPLQIISGQISREVGLVDPTAILQESTAATGFQTDLTYSAFRVDNGPGATTVDLRGLGDNRTLVLVNGRRLAPAGVEGAPYASDANLIPGSLVQQYEVLLDGASSVYGSDAIAGVVNVILRKDFDGLELEAYSSVPAGGNSAGTQNQINATWGYNWDRGVIGIGAQYRDVEAVRLADRKATAGCEKHREITTEGEIRTEDLFYSTVFNMKPFGECQFLAATNFMNPFGGPTGSLLATPGTTNVGIPGWSDFTAYGVPVDTTGDGITDVSFVDISLNGKDRYAYLVPDIQTTAVLAFGEYTFSGDANITPYFELQYNKRESYFLNTPTNLGMTVPANSQFNPCNPSAPGGVDCGLAFNTLLTNPNYEADFFATYGGTPTDFGLLEGPAGPFPVLPVVTIRGDRDNSTTELDQTRIVLGVRGDMPFMKFGPVDDWAFDFYLTHTESDGTSSRLGVREDRLNLALGNYSVSGTPCQNDGVEVFPDTEAGCVPVNPFAPSLYADVVNNDFATQAERDFVFDSRDFRTKYQQSVAFVYLNGEVLDLPGGKALFGIGGEYRRDEIESIPDVVAAEGLFRNFFVDRGAVGEKDTKEVFAEIELPLLANIPAAQELTINASTRYTKDEFFPGAWTYSGKLAWRPVDSLLLRGTVGTSYRAPNLRENFLEDQTGFVEVTDPCVVPPDAVDPINGYDPTLDRRPPEVIANCQADPNVDPFTFTNGGNTFYFIESAEGGATDIKEETSESMSAGLTWEQPFFTAFDFVIGATYYEIEIKDEIVSPSPFFIIGDCYGDLQGDSPWCARIARDSDTSQISLVNASFINRDRLKARGVDLNLRFEWPTQVFGRAVDFGADFAFNRNLELSARLLEDVDAEETIEVQGEVGYPEWKGRMLFRADVGDFRYTWGVRYLSSVVQDPDSVDDFGGIFDASGADTCLGEAFGDVDCRNYGDIGNYFTHDASVYFNGDTWTIGAGIRNIFDEVPDFIDPAESFTRTNVPYGAGYDILGRTLFMNVVWRWQ